MADGLSIVVQSEASDKVREYGQCQFMEGVGIKPNNDLSSAPINEDIIQLRLTSGGVLYYWDGTSWEVVNLSAIITESLNLGNTDLTLSSNRTLSGNNKSLTMNNLSSLLIESLQIELSSANAPIFKTTEGTAFNFVVEGGYTLQLVVPITANTTLSAPDNGGTIATESLITFPLTSNSSGIISDATLVGKKIGTIMGASTPFEEGYQFVKPTSGDTIFDASTYDPDAPSNDPFIFLANQKYFLTPIVP